MSLRLALRARKFRSKWDPQEINWILEHVRTGDTVFDIGAHKGGWTYWLRKTVGRSGRVFAFEPQPVLYDYLEGLFDSGYWSNVTLENIALSNANGTAKIYVPAEPGGSSPGATLKKHVVKNENNPFSEEVELLTLDDYARQNGLENIDFIKMDVEGSELDTLEGARNILSRHRTNWIIESEARHVGEDGVLRLFEIMKSSGHQGFFFASSGLIDVSEFSFSKDQSTDGDRFWDHAGYCNNFLFIPHSP